MENKENNQMYAYWFANVKGISNKRKKELQSKVLEIEELYNIEETRINKLLQISQLELDAIKISKSKWNIEREYKVLGSKNIRFITFKDPDYPTRLLQVESSPYALYVKGEVPNDTTLTVAIVGARKCSPYGEYYGREFAQVLGSMGVQVISGLAKGIDGISQRSAIQAGGKSFGVLACGVDICYPRENLGLYMDLQEQGGVISEQPIGTPPLASYFPARNRIISGLSDVILVIEAKEKSGSLITADMALEQGKDIYALPGPINSVLSQGCNYLIKQGAGILISPEDLIAELNVFCENKMKYLERKKIILERKENIVYSCLGFQTISLNQLVKEVSLPISEILSILISLELKGLIREISKNYYVKIKD